MKIRLRKWGIALSVLLAVVLAGCQAVAGVNLNDMVLKQLEVASAEQSETVELEIDWNEKYLQAEEPKLAKLAGLLGKVTLKIDHAKTDKIGRTQYEGSLKLGGKDPISFVVHIDETHILLDLEGAKQPLVVNYAQAAGVSPVDLGFGLEQDQALLRKLLREAAGYFVEHLPNPPKVEVTRGFSSVNSQSLHLTKVHAELNGQQFGDLLIQYLEAFAQDEEGFRNMLSSVLKMLAEIDPELLEEFGGREAATDAQREQVVEDAVQSVFPLLQEGLAQLKEAKANPEWDMFFDPGILLTADLYLDNQLHVRKSDAELTIAPIILQIPTSPVHRITLRSHSETWNVNGDITVPPVSAPENALVPEDLEDWSAYQFVQLFKPDSVMYDLLKNEFEIDDSRFEINEFSFYGTAPLLAGEGESKAVHVPVRDVVESFESELEFDPDTMTIRFTDAGTGQVIELAVGSSEAKVDGQPVALREPPYLLDGYTYMAADDLFQLLKASYTYEVDEWDSLRVTVERDL